MHIGIIGAGNIGANLTRRLTAVGHTVAVANSRNPETIADLAAETGATAVTAADAARDADLVVVTIPERAVPALAKGILDAAKPGAPVVDTGNYYPKERDGLIAEIEGGTTESRWVSEHLGRPVVKAFNGIYAAHLVDKAVPRGTPGRIALPVAGDDAEAKAKVMALIDEIGFDAVDAGGIDESWRQQPGTPVYGAEVDAEGVAKALAAASQERTGDFKA